MREKKGFGFLNGVVEGLNLYSDRCSIDIRESENARKKKVLLSNLYFTFPHVAFVNLIHLTTLPLKKRVFH